ncbi:MAG TPA: D-alanyl-D-alanine carboxypeptidase family protein [Candidatus Methylomirabilis sp.]|nr:D-alanyl-D-alanine carboxypeptidase family protein [Candidatus Methylomirabilis sp.]
MRRRVLACGCLAFILLGTTSSALAAPNRAGAQKHRTAHRKASLPRDRSWTSRSLPESLDLLRPGPREVSAVAAVLMDANTGEVLYARNPDEPLPPASVTKILTALVVLERGRLADTVVVSQEAARVGGYQLGLRRGQQISLGDLLGAILIRSANDAAVAAAEHVGDGLAGFVDLMNAKAEALGMQHSHFANPHGLDEPGHFTTARDMAVLTRVALENPHFAGLVRTRELTVTIWNPGRRGPMIARARLIQGHNKLLGRLDGADGVKTGYTGAAGRCLVASASRGNRRMIAVLLNDPNRWADAASLLEYGFESSGSAAGVRDGDHPRPFAWAAVGRN